MAFVAMENEFTPAEYEQVTPDPHESVDVATQVGTPPDMARTNPAVPAVRLDRTFVADP